VILMASHPSSMVSGMAGGITLKRGITRAAGRASARA
jgi:hypothetical protein